MFQIQSVENNYTLSMPSTSRLNINSSSETKNDCYTVWEPLQLRQEWTVCFLIKKIKLVLYFFNMF